MSMHRLPLAKRQAPPVTTVGMAVFSYHGPLGVLPMVFLPTVFGGDVKAKHEKEKEKEDEEDDPLLVDPAELPD